MQPLTLRQMVAYSVGNLGLSLFFGFANFAFPLYLTAYPVSNLVVGLLAQSRSLVAGLVQPLVGVLSDRLPPNPLGRRRPFFLIGTPPAVVMLIVLATRPPLWGVVVAMTLAAVFVAVVNDPYFALLPDIAPSEQRGLIGGVMALFNILGVVGVAILGYLLWDSQQYLVFWLIALGFVVTVAITFVAVPEPSIGSEPRPPRPSLAKYVRDLLGRGELMKYLAMTFFFWLGNGGTTPFLTRFAVDVLGVPENIAFLAVLPAVLGAVIFAVPAGLLARRYGNKPVLAVGLLLFGLSSLVGVQLVQHLVAAALVLVVAGAANAITTALAFPLLTDLIPRARAGELTGVASFIGSIAQPLGAAGAGAMADATGTLRTAFAVGGLAMLLAFAILLTVQPGGADSEATTA